MQFNSVRGGPWLSAYLVLYLTLRKRWEKQAVQQTNIRGENKSSLFVPWELVKNFLKYLCSCLQVQHSLAFKIPSVEGWTYSAGCSVVCFWSLTCFGHISVLWWEGTCLHLGPPHAQFSLQKKPEHVNREEAGDTAWSSSESRWLGEGNICTLPSMPSLQLGALWNATAARHRPGEKEGTCQDARYWNAQRKLRTDSWHFPENLAGG